MENEQSTNQKCLDFLESTETERQKISESLEDEFEVSFSSFQEVLAEIRFLCSETTFTQDYKDITVKTESWIG